jgi:hypothetical protein
MKGKLAFVGAVSALALAFATPAFAYGSNAATVGTSVSSVGPGGSLTVSGNNFVPNTNVTITLHSTPVVLATTSSNSSGSFFAVVTIPAGTAPGTHTIIATDSAGDSASTILVVTGTVTVAASSGLAFTGADIAALSAVGAVAMALGGMLILTGRRRRRVA